MLGLPQVLIGWSRLQLPFVFVAEGIHKVVGKKMLVVVLLRRLWADHQETPLDWIPFAFGFLFN